MQDEQVVARDMIVELDDPVVGKVKLAGNPIKMTHLPEDGKRGKVPTVGEHSPELLEEFLGYSASKVSDLKQRGVI